MLAHGELVRSEHRHGLVQVFCSWLLVESQRTPAIIGSIVSSERWGRVVEEGRAVV